MPRFLYPIRAGLGGNPKGAAVGVQGWTAGNFVQSAVATLCPGSAGGFGIAAALCVQAMPDATANISTCGGGASKGWLLRHVGGTSFRFSASDGGGVGVLSPTSAIGAGDVGKIVLFHGVWDAAAGRLRLYRAGVEVGIGTAMVGYTPATVADRVTLGSSPLRQVGNLYFTGIPQPADILAHYNACKAANTMESMGGAGVVNVNRWQAKDNLPNAATWVDDIGGMILTKTGTLSSVIFTPVWE